MYVPQNICEPSHIVSYREWRILELKNSTGSLIKMDETLSQRHEVAESVLTTTALSLRAIRQVRILHLRLSMIVSST